MCIYIYTYEQSQTPSSKNTEVAYNKSTEYNKIKKEIKSSQNMLQEKRNLGYLTINAKKKKQLSRVQ
jgi:hypothetical protein